jgi:hypothetical protein
MLGILRTILCWISAVFNAVLWGVMTGVNSIIAGIGAAIGTAIAALPTMPGTPSWTGVVADVFGYANWVFPIGLLVSTLASIALLWAAWQIASVFLRFGKMTQ